MVRVKIVMIVADLKQTIATTEQEKQSVAKPNVNYSNTTTLENHKALNVEDISPEPLALSSNPIGQAIAKQEKQTAEKSNADNSETESPIPYMPDVEVVSSPEAPVSDTTPTGQASTSAGGNTVHNQHLDLAVVDGCSSWTSEEACENYSNRVGKKHPPKKSEGKEPVPYEKVLYRYCFNCHFYIPDDDHGNETEVCTMCRYNVGYKCTKCYWGFETYEGAYAHLNDFEKILCPVCSYPTYCPVYMTSHMTVHNQNQANGE